MWRQPPSAVPRAQRAESEPQQQQKGLAASEALFIISKLFAGRSTPPQSPHTRPAPPQIPSCTHRSRKNISCPRTGFEIRHCCQFSFRKLDPSSFIPPSKNLLSPSAFPIAKISPFSRLFELSDSSVFLPASLPSVKCSLEKSSLPVHVIPSGENRRYSPESLNSLSAFPVQALWTIRPPTRSLFSPPPSPRHRTPPFKHSAGASSRTSLPMSVPKNLSLGFSSTAPKILN
jgi:hypothetical protein